MGRGLLRKVVVLVKAFIAVIKHHSQEQLGEEGVYLSLQLHNVVHHQKEVRARSQAGQEPGGRRGH